MELVEFISIMQDDVGLTRPQMKAFQDSVNAAMRAACNGVAKGDMEKFSENFKSELRKKGYETIEALNECQGCRGGCQECNPKVK
jgi:hypothetical protein